jgi:DNA-binding response OmpR family regulator
MAPTLLIVDDDPVLLNTLALLFEEEGYRVRTANTFEHGEFELQRSLPDVLLVDIRLGAFNGLQLTAMADRAIPTIVMTGHDDATLKHTAHRFGAEFLVKPVPFDELFAAVRRQLLAGVMTRSTSVATR